MSGQRSKIDEQSLPVAQERDKDADSKFWATYEKVSTEYDDDFLARANDDMGIILTFAGLFSAVNSTFIVGMQPNPGDTTNVLLLYLIQMTANGTNTVNDISNLSSTTGYSSSTVWMQTLAYASLAFSVLAAFGAVLGKQWLNSYKAARGRGSLEERGMQRQRKLDGLEYFHLQTVLQAFLVLLQISLLLFGLSLSANMWTQQTTIASVIICTTVFGILFYGLTIFASMWRPDSPFHTPGSELLGAICKKFLPHRSTLTSNGTFIKLSAIRWILETSTNPEVVEAAAAMVPLVQWPPELASAISTRLWDTFEACHDREELFVKCGKAMVHLFSNSLRSPLWVEWVFSESWHRWGGRSCFIRDAFMDGRIACSHLKNTQQEGARWKHKADMRTALRTMLVHGQRYRLSRPDHEQLIWYGDLQWRQNDGHTPGYEDFDWLVDYLADEAMNDTDDETVGDALLALSAMRGFGSDAKRHSYITALIRCMGPTRPPRVRHAALRSVSDARGELASITSGSMPHGVDAKLLDELSRAFLTAVRPNQDQTMHGFGADASFHEDRDRCYFRLIFALIKEDEWRQRLTRDGHLERCTSLFGEGLACGSRTLECYLAGILTYVDFPGNVPPFGPTQERWRTLIMPQWRRLSSVMLPDVVEAVPALVMATRQNLPSSDDGARSMELTSLARDVHGALESLQEENAALLNFGLVSQADADAALSSLQGFRDDLGRMTENLGTLQKDTGSLGY